MLLRQSPLIASPNPCPIPRNPRSYPISRILFSRCCFGTLRDRSLPSLQCCASKGSDAAAVEAVTEVEVAVGEAESREAGGAGSAGVSVGIGSPALTAGLGLYRMSLGDQAFFLLAFIACTTSVAFTSLVVAAIPTLLAMRRTATSLARLADTATEELPSTMAAIRLSGMEISDLTLELSDLSQEISDGISKSAQAVQAAEAGIRQIGALARCQTVSMIEERANLPNISLKPMVAGAARKTSHVVGKAKKTFMNIISGGEHSQKSEDMSDKVEI
ncbi:uncharacterized protein LOC135610141 [Musa acuminata AAA Group]|uniref:(wild Malaysian banana) hypothetical protein n=1 Tax=Musa acuminata subsp. malaccensis TaxID=214687 RepID=A0A804IQA9_MUSAM|nr:PREDICTED: uncharacterized protein LOC103981779 [Musa acuminata subsp. malaccensis]CAG1842490.1 unnamed protein product [Musa acuminata subsp. malaccensis]